MDSASETDSSSLATEFDDSLSLRPSDMFTVKLVQERLTGSENYFTWSCAMKNALQARGKMGFVDGSFPKPDADSPLLGQWERCNAVVLSWIRSSLSKELSRWFICATGASEVWKELEEAFSAVNGIRIFNIFRKVAMLVQGNRSVSACFEEFERLWDEYESVLYGPNPDSITCVEYRKGRELEKLMQFLMGLNHYYNEVRNQILIRSPLPSVDEAFATLRLAESMRVLPEKKATGSRGW